MSLQNKQVQQDTVVTREISIKIKNNRLKDRLTSTNKWNNRFVENKEKP